MENVRLREILKKKDEEISQLRVASRSESSMGGDSQDLRERRLFEQIQIELAPL